MDTDNTGTEKKKSMKNLSPKTSMNTGKKKQQQQKNSYTHLF